VEHPILREKAYTIIKQKLLSHEIQPGVRIREDLLAREVSMSRTPVREAINQLAAEGFIVSLPRKGLFCVTLTRDEFLEFLSVREVLEVLALEKCIQRVTDDEVARLDKILCDYQEMLLSQRLREASELDSKFHKEIAAFSRNRKLIEFIGQLEDFMRIARAMERPDMSPDEQDLSIRQHRAILDCIRRRDAVGGLEAIRANIRGMRKKLGIQDSACASSSQPTS